MTRRDMALSSIAAAAALNADTFAGPRFDPVAWSRERHKAAPLRYRFAANSPAAVKSWQRKLRTKITELIGGFPAQAPVLAPRITQTADLGTYTRETIHFTSREGLEVFSYLLKPKDAKGPLPVMVCVPGHGRGVDDIVGLDDKGQQRSAKGGYQNDFAIQFVEQGMAALAIEPIAFGHRRDPINAAKGPNQNSCQPAAGAALLFGETMIGWRVYDVMRAIDFVESRKDLDARRLGCVGISGGGTCTLFASALDTRIQAAMVSGYLCTFHDCILSLAHCMDNYVPGILNWAEMSDVAGLIAPRPLFVETGEQDRIFPLAGFEQAFAETRRVYEALGAATALDREVHSGGHVFHGVKGVPFLANYLKGL
ncbi:MAG: alpha/beta hydrolase family protein [Acidobacteriota bacterium]